MKHAGRVEVARVAIRVSRFKPRDDENGDEATRSESGDTYSREFQLESAKRLAAFEGWHLDEEASLKHADMNVSGFRRAWRTRPGMMAHYEAARRGEFKHLIFYKLSRLGRNVRESLDLIDAFEREGVTIHCVHEKIDSSSPAGRMMRTILLAVAEMQSEDISQFLKDTVIQRARSGKLQGGVLPLWLARDPGTGEIERVPEVVSVVRELVNLRIEGHGYMAITRKLNLGGFLKPGGMPWRAGEVYKYLRDDWIDSMCGTGFLNREKPEGHPERVVIPDVFPPILTDEEADQLRAVQALYRREPMTSPIPGAGNWTENKAKAKRNGRYSASSNHLLAGFIFCACCGHRLHGGIHGKDREYLRTYNCDNARTGPHPHPKGAKMTSGECLEDAVLRVVRHFLDQPPPPQERPQPRRRPAGRSLAQIDSDTDKLLNLHYRELISEDDFSKRYAALQQERERLQVHDAERDKRDSLEAARRLIEQDNLSRPQLRQLISLLVERVEAPVTFPEVYVRGPGTGLRRHARVFLRFPTNLGVTRYLAPIYTTRYTGPREVIPDLPRTDR